MSTAFSILPASTAIPLDATGKGAASFTVTNQTGHPVRVRVAVTPVGDPLPPVAWFTPPEISERDLAIDGAAQFTVLITVPPKSLAGTYLFRLDAVSTQLPDEEWAHSPEVHFLVPETPDEPPPPPPPPPPTRKGYVESVIGCEIGAMGLGLAFGVPSKLLRIISNGSGPLDSIGGLLLVLTPIAFLVGSALGIVWYLRRQGIDGPYETALPTALILIFWSIFVLVVLLLAGLALGLNFTGNDIVFGVVAGLLTALVPPLIGRAIYRFRSTGGL
jgi:hypothetical protein